MKTLKLTVIVIGIAIVVIAGYLKAKLKSIWRKF